MSKEPNKADQTTVTIDEATSDDRNEEAAEILTDLLSNQATVSRNDTNGSDVKTQVGEAQQAALQQLIRQEPSGVLNEKSVRALLDAMGGGVVQDEGEKKHVFWDTQVR
jgi:hypothetical protein